MLGHSPLATQPYAAGHQHLNVTVNLSAFSPLALSLGTTGIEISKNVDAPSLLATLSVGTVLFEGDANVVLTNEVSHYGTDVYGNANSLFSEASYTEELTTSIGTITIEGAANITVSGFELTLLNMSTNSFTLVNAEFESVVAIIEAAEDVVEFSLNS